MHTPNHKKWVLLTKMSKLRDWRYGTVPFTGTFTALDTGGWGTMTLSAAADASGSSTQ